MYRDQSVAVVVPAHNEERFVGRVIEGLPEFVDKAYVVDDCSTDETWTAIREAAARVNEPESVVLVEDGGSRSAERIVPIRHTENRGRGGAVKTGYRRALEDEIDLIAVMDGDDQMDPDYLDQILDPVAVGEADYAVGDRFSRVGTWNGMPTGRLFGSLVLTLLTRIASGYWNIRDSQNGYTAISAPALEALDLEGLYDDYGFLNDILVKLNVADARVKTVSIRARYGDEESGIRLKRLIPRLSVLLLTDFLWRLYARYLTRGEYAVVGLYGLGALGFLAGLVDARPRIGAESIPSNRGLRAMLISVFAILAGMVGDWWANRDLRR